MTDEESQREVRSGELLGLDRRELLARHARGDAVAFRELVEHYRREIFTYLVRAGVDAAARDDIFQEVILSLHKSAARYDSRQPLRPWVYTITVNCVRSHYRRESSRRDFPDGGAPECGAAPTTPYEARAAAETSGWIEDQLRRLPFEQREVIVLHCVRGLEQKDIAVILDIPVNTVKTHLRRARMTLAAQLAEREQISERESRHD